RPRGCAGPRLGVVAPTIRFRLAVPLRPETQSRVAFLAGSPRDRRGPPPCECPREDQPDREHAVAPALGLEVAQARLEQVEEPDHAEEPVRPAPDDREA